MEDLESSLPSSPICRPIKGIDGSAETFWREQWLDHIVSEGIFVGHFDNLKA
jgi:hypothetical protein